MPSMLFGTLKKLLPRLHENDLGSNEYEIERMFKMKEKDTSRMSDAH